MDHGAAHRSLIHAVRLRLGREPDVLLYVNVNAVLESTDGRKMRAGLCRGASDLIGVGPGGRFLALEAKTGAGRCTDDQAMFLELVRKRGGIAGVFRSVDEAVLIVEEARR